MAIDEEGRPLPQEKYKQDVYREMEILHKYFKNGETAQKTLERLGLFEQVAKQYILTQDIDRINEFMRLRPGSTYLTFKEIK